MEKGRGSVRLKFWQKTYLLTLALFLLALGGGTTAIASVSQQRAFEAECGKLLAQQHSVAQSLAADAAAVQARRPEALPRLAQNYAGQLKRSGVFLRVAQAGDVWADELPQPDSALPEVPPEGQRVHTVLLSGGRHVLYISAVLPAPPEDVAVTCAFDMEAVRAVPHGMRRTCVSRPKAGDKERPACGSRGLTDIRPCPARAPCAAHVRRRAAARSAAGGLSHWGLPA